MEEVLPFAELEKREIKKAIKAYNRNIDKGSSSSWNKQKNALYTKIKKYEIED